MPAKGTKSSEDVYLKGTFKWVRHLTPDFQFEPDGKWSMVIYLEGAELEKARLLQTKGIKNTIKNDDEGWYMTLSRKCSYDARGRKVGREPPKVFQVIDGQDKPIMEMVGNGSSGVAKCVLWGSANYPGKNLRWEAARVDHLVPFNSEKDWEDGGESVKELKEQEELF